MSVKINNKVKILDKDIVFNSFVGEEGVVVGFKEFKGVEQQFPIIVKLDDGTIVAFKNEELEIIN